MPIKQDSIAFNYFNPLFFKPGKKNTGLMSVQQKTTTLKYAAARGGELMHWPNYPLTTAQIIARQEQWHRRNNQSIGKQVAGDIANDIIRNQVNSLIYGKKMPVAVIPKF